MACGTWQKEHRSSGATYHVRSCGRKSAQILVGTTTYNIKLDGREIKRGSAKTLRAAKAAASRLL